MANWQFASLRSYIPALSLWERVAARWGTGEGKFTQGRIAMRLR